MSFIVRIFEPADGGFGCADPFRELLLREAGFCPELKNLAGNLRVDDILFVFLFALEIARDIAVVKKL